MSFIIMSGHSTSYEGLRYAWVKGMGAINENNKAKELKEEKKANLSIHNMVVPRLGHVKPPLHVNCMVM